MNFIPDVNSRKFQLFYYDLGFSTLEFPFLRYYEDFEKGFYQNIRF